MHSRRQEHFWRGCIQVSSGASRLPLVHHRRGEAMIANTAAHTATPHLRMIACICKKLVLSWPNPLALHMRRTNAMTAVMRQTLPNLPSPPSLTRMPQRPCTSHLK